MAADASGASATLGVEVELRNRLIRWIFFGVIFAVFPVFANVLSALTRSTEVGFDDLLGRGELLLISAVVAAASAGELFGQQESRLKSTRLFLVAISFLLVGVSSYWYADISAAGRASEEIATHAVAVGSTVVFILTCVVGGCCIVVSELR